MITIQWRVRPSKWGKKWLPESDKKWTTYDKVSNRYAEEFLEILRALPYSNLFQFRIKPQ